jgi:hypothetical protein
VVCHEMGMVVVQPSRRVVVCLVQGLRGVISDVTWVEGLGGPYQAGIPLHGSPASLCCPPSVIDSLTSHLDGEEVVGRPCVCLHVLDSRRS